MREAALDEEAVTRPIEKEESQDTTQKSGSPKSDSANDPRTFRIILRKQRWICGACVRRSSDRFWIQR